LFIIFKIIIDDKNNRNAKKHDDFNNLHQICCSSDLG